jgi:predicted secreted protein
MKTIAITLAALIAGSAIAAPALASDSAFDSDRYITLLGYEGVTATAVDEGWLDTVRATITLEDGSTVFRFFDKDSLQPVSFGG